MTGHTCGAVTIKDPFYPGPIPLRQLGVAGFDRFSESACFIPSLTTVKQDFRGLGALAVGKIKQLQEPEMNSSNGGLDTTILTPE